MKQYIFFYNTSRRDEQYKEYKIEASGMMEALLKAKKMKASIEEETSSNIKFQFKGIVY